MSNLVFPIYMTCYAPVTVQASLELGNNLPKPGMGIPKYGWIIRNLVLQCQIYALRSPFIHLRNVSSYTPLKDAVTKGNKYFNYCEKLSY